MAIKVKSLFRRFLIVGAINTLIDFLLFMAIQAYLPLFIATFIASIVAMTFSFLANGRYTFSLNKFTLKQGFLFLGTTGVVMWIIQPLLIHGFTIMIDNSSLDPTEEIFLSKLIATGICFLLNFTLYRYVVWPQKVKKDEIHAIDMDGGAM